MVKYVVEIKIADDENSKTIFKAEDETELMHKTFSFINHILNSVNKLNFKEVEEINYSCKILCIRNGDKNDF